MPSFTRRVPVQRTAAGAAGPAVAAATAAAPAPAQNFEGTRPSPSAPGLRLLPSGIGSLDDLLGGGLPLGNVLTLLSPDPHTAWARLVARHVAAQGAVSRQRIIVLAERGDGRAFVDGLPWVEGRDDAGSESETEGGVDDGRTRIAWRYDRMAKFQTTVGGLAVLAVVLMDREQQPGCEHDHSGRRARAP